MIEQVETSLDLKMKLIPLLVHMHHDTIISAKARKLCREMLNSYPRIDISKIILNTLTQIACKAVTNIHETITFFIKLLHEEPRDKLHLILLNNLNVLAKRVQHLWTGDHINDFIRYMISRVDNELLIWKSSEILCTLVRDSANLQFFFVLNQNIELNSPLDNDMTIIDNKQLKTLIDILIFSENKSIAINMCLFCTALFDYHKSSFLNNNQNGLVNSDCLNIKDLFELTKAGLNSLIIQCDNSIEMFYQQKDSNKLENEIKILKVNLIS
jgi:hypothetical protein